jgi:hypothetical protein
MRFEGRRVTSLAGATIAIGGDGGDGVGKDRDHFAIGGGETGARRSASANECEPGARAGDGDGDGVKTGERAKIGEASPSESPYEFSIATRYSRSRRN